MTVMSTSQEDAQEAKRRKLEAKLTGATAPPQQQQQQQQQQQKSSSPDAAAEGAQDAAEHGPFVCEANDVVSFRIVTGAADMDTAEPFEPEFTHQVFRDDETIFGYRELDVKVYIQANLCKSLVEISYAEKVQSTLNPPDDVLALLKKHFPDVYTDRAAFLAALEADAGAPIPAGGGEIVAEYDSPPATTTTTEGGVKVSAAAAAGGGNEENNHAEEEGCKDTVRVFRLCEEEVWKWHARFEPMTMFYIDAASPLDSEDERWLLFAVIRSNPRNKTWRLVSFATVYQFFMYPCSTRARLSQIIVLPPYQRQGLGGRVLEAVRSHAVGKGFHDITVEDPTTQLQRLRDVADVRALTQLPEVMTAVRSAAMAAAGLKSGDDAAASKAALELPAAVVEMARAKLCICKPQMRRCWEALLYMTAKKAGAPNDSPAARAFSELVIRRLKALHCSDAQRDAGTKRVYPTKTGFVMMRGRGTGGQAPDMEEDSEDKQDPAEVLAEYFHDTMSNLSWLASAVKI